MVFAGVEIPALVASNGAPESQTAVRCVKQGKQFAMKYETTLARPLFTLIVLSSAAAITAFAQSDTSGPAPAAEARGLDAEPGKLDAETRRFQTEVAQLDVRDNVRRTWVYAFKISTPENRANIWQELEQARQQPDADLSAIIAEAAAERAERDARADDYDEETRRYKAALERAGYTSAEVDGLVEIFAPSAPVIRQVYWAEVNKRLGSGQ
jgi:hypothetical protein